MKRGLGHGRDGDDGAPWESFPHMGKMAAKGSFTLSTCTDSKIIG